MIANNTLASKYNEYNRIGLILTVLCTFLIFLGRTRAPWLLFDLLFLVAFVYVYFSRAINTDLIAIGALIGLITIFFFIQLQITGLNLLVILRFYYNIRFIFLIYFFAQLIKNDRIDIKKILFHIYIVGCIQFFINIPFIVQEYLAEPWNIDEHNGLFGHGSSHATGIFWLFLINYGLLRDKYKLFTALLIILALFLSSLTDNKFFYVAIVLSVAMYVSKKPKLIIQAIVLSIVAFAIVVISYKIILPFQTFIDTAIFRSYDVYINSDNADRSERSIIMDYILSFPDSFVFGKGMGAVSSIFDFEGKQVNLIDHINMNELFIQVFETGVWNTFVLIAAYAYSFALIWNKKRFLIFAIMTPIIAGMFYYSRFISDPRQIFFFMLIIICYSLPNFSEDIVTSKVPKKKFVARSPNLV